MTSAEHRRHCEKLRGGAWRRPDSDDAIQLSRKRWIASFDKIRACEFCRWLATTEKAVGRNIRATLSSRDLIST
jgi:hypothetical protein